MPVVVFLHGFTGSARDWDAIIRDGTGLFKSYAIDLPGHGENIHHENQDAYSFLGAAKIAADSIKQITNTPVHLVGYSMGGRIAIYVALRWPTLFASLIIESATAGLSDHDSRQKRMCVDSKLAKQIFSMSIDEFLCEWYSQPLFASLSNEQKENIIHARLENNVLELGKSLEGLSIGAQPSLWDRLSDISMPATFITGCIDKKYTDIAAKMAGLCKRGQSVIVPNAGHNVHVEQPSAFSQCIKKHLISLG